VVVLEGSFSVAAVGVNKADNTIDAQRRELNEKRAQLTSLLAQDEDKLLASFICTVSRVAGVEKISRSCYICRLQP